MSPDESYLLAVVGEELWRATLGKPIGKRMAEPQPGDLVLEISTMGPMTIGRFDPDRIGRLLRIEGDRQVVAPLHDLEREQGWQNATFIALPDQAKWVEVSSTSQPS